MFPIYDCISSLKLPLLLHVGFDPSFTQGYRRRSTAFDYSIGKFPSLTMIAAPYGRSGLLSRSANVSFGKPIYIDTAIASHF